MSKGESTRSAILSSALDLASEVGLRSLSIGALAERTSLSKSGLFAHFASKENLEVAVLEEASARFIAHVVTPALKARRGEPRVRALFERWLDWANLLSGGCIFVASAVDLDDRECPARDCLVSSQKDWIATLAGAARIAVEEKHFRKDLDLAQFAFEMFSIAYGYHFVHRLIRDGKAEARARAAFERLVQDARRPS